MINFILNKFFGLDKIKEEVDQGITSAVNDVADLISSFNIFK